MLSRSTDKKETRGGFFEELNTPQAQTIKERVWREKVSEALGEEKIKKKTKNMV
jgi:hypothetical protein